MAINDYLPGLAGVPATKSNISYIDGEKGVLAYRGYPIETLAKHSGFEETACLLLGGELPDAQTLANFKADLSGHRALVPEIHTLLKTLPVQGHPMQVLQSVVAGLGIFYPDEVRETTNVKDYQDMKYAHAMSVKLIARVATIVALWQRVRTGNATLAPRTDLSFAENFLYMFSGREPQPVLAELLDKCLILHAEHTINASTFVAMVAGSTLTNPFGMLSAAIGTLSGPLHGGANQRVIEMLEEIGSPARARAWLDKKLDAKEIIWGMGHREYSVKDPRASILQKLVERFAMHRSGKPGNLFETALALEKATEARLGAKGVYPNVDFYSGILYAEMGIPPDQFTSLFAIARAPGWLAHWYEQLTHNRIIRPTQLYVGEALRDYVPIENRSSIAQMSSGAT
jgi:citrate synthase